MARRPRTYEWRDNAVECVEIRGGAVPRYAPQQRRRKTAQLGIQEWLALFTLSSVLMVFAGGALAGVLAFMYAVFFN